MSKLFKVKAKLKQEDPKAGERIRYVSLLVLANDKSKSPRGGILPRRGD